MKKIDFSRVPVELRIGEAEETNLCHSVGNAINRNTCDIGLADFARSVFYSTAAVEIPNEYMEEIIAILNRDQYLLAPAKMAVLKLLQEEVADMSTDAGNKEVE